MFFDYQDIVMGLFKKKEEFTEERYVQTLLKDQIRDRRWRSFSTVIKAIAFLIMACVGYLMTQRPLPWEEVGIKENHTALINIQGVIANDSLASADKVNYVLREAFKNPSAKAVIIKINSPGGSAVQAGRIHDEILQLKQYFKKPVYAIIDDMGASGGYYIAIAADKIYANRASLVGSIGVISAGFGFSELLEKLGVERRVIRSGANKNFLDPFSPLTEDQKIFWEDVLAQTHQQFVKRVKEARGDKLDAKKEDIFSGLIWNGEQAKEIGLIDDLNTPENIARYTVGESNLIEYIVKKDMFTQIKGYSSFNLRTLIDDATHYLESNSILLNQ